MIDADKIIALRDTLYARQGGRCAVCGEMLDWMTFHAAHRIPQRKHWLRRYGKDVIHHPDNFFATCPTDRCNNAISIGNNRMRADDIAEEIEKNMP